jgi:hypothetical protein
MQRMRKHKEKPLVYEPYKKTGRPEYEPGVPYTQRRQPARMRNKIKEKVFEIYTSSKHIKLTKLYK